MSRPGLEAALSEAPTAQPPPAAAASPPVAAPALAPAPPGTLTLIGIGHVFQIRDTVRDAVAALAPDIVFIELDRGRLEALLARERGEAVPQPKAWSHRKLQQFQESVAQMYGASVGSEMLGALEGARAAGARVALIDPPAEATLAAARKLTWRERLRMAGMVAGGAVRSLWPPSRRRARAKMEEDIQRYQEDPVAALEEVRRSFPTLHRAIVDERDAIMARRIRKGLTGARHGVAVLGDAHLDGVLRRLEGITVTTYRLADVRAGRLPAPPGRFADVGAGGAKAGFGFDGKA